jgi:hypothetical protein
MSWIFILLANATFLALLHAARRRPNARASLRGFAFVLGGLTLGSILGGLISFVTDVRGPNPGPTSAVALRALGVTDGVHGPALWALSFGAPVIVAIVLARRAPKPPETAS